MPGTLKERWKRATWAVVRVVQAVLITILLTLVYLGIVGPMRLIAWVFRMRLPGEAGPAKGQSYWEETADDDPDIEQCRRQS